MDSESPVESTYPAESRGRKRKASTRTGDQATDRKRTQNRISQQCARERQTAYIRQMESFIDLLRSSTEGDTDDTEYTKLLKAHLKLLDDKRNAEESLFRFRQKLLSVGNMATSAAEDPIFQSLSESPSAQTNPAPPESNKKASPAASPYTLEAMPTLGIGDSASIIGQPPEYSLGDGGIRNISDRPPQEETNLGDIPQWQQDMDTLFRQYTAATQLSHPTIPSPFVFPALSPGWPLPQLSFPNMPLGIDAMGSSGGLGQPQVPAFVQITQSNSEGLMVIKNSTIFADQVRSAAKHVMFTSMRSPWNYAGSNSPPADSPEMVERLASVAVEVIGALAGLQTYIYGVHFSKYMEYVMRWRISNRLEDRLAIPVPFRPTPLQAATPDHPMVIDFINWPSIRDHMILYSTSLDLDAMSRDIVLNTVIELPRKQVAVNIYELFFTHILPTIRGGQGEVKDSMLHNPEWIYLTVSPNSTPASVPTPSPTQEVLAAEIAERMGLHLDNLPSCDSSTPPSVNINTPLRTANKDVSQYQMVSCKAVIFENVHL
ncbi:hypothetical protein BKA56DRAFT_677150 [Ilyonectria sp. MPI-CAGE-AT-0026]|nr:hypothetical protein BKA56DRAFT_677150 [Ilyonectria sp. MPI-CAGE-AT-0026]